MCARRLRDATSVAGLAEWPKDDCADRETSSRESSSRGRVANASDAMAIVVKTSESSSQARNVHNSKLYFDSVSVELKLERWRRALTDCER